MKQITKYYEVHPDEATLFFPSGVELCYYLPEEFDEYLKFRINSSGELEVIQSN